MKQQTLILLAAAVAVTATSAKAELKWEQTQIELHPSLTDVQSVGTFKYENVGSTPVRITDVKTSCGCTVASRTKDIAAPGEKGEITATFNIGGRTGPQQKMITVMTDDPAHPQTVLTLKATVPSLLEVQPTFVRWDANEEGTTKVITVKANPDYPVTKLTVTSSNADLTTSVEPGAGPKEWKVNVALKPDAHPAPNAVAQLTIAPDYPKDAPKLYYATVRLATAQTAAAVPPPAIPKASPPP